MHILLRSTQRWTDSNGEIADSRAKCREAGPIATALEHSQTCPQTRTCLVSQLVHQITAPPKRELVFIEHRGLRRLERATHQSERLFSRGTAFTLCGVFRGEGFSGSCRSSVVLRRKELLHIARWIPTRFHPSGPTKPMNQETNDHCPPFLREQTGPKKRETS